MKSWLDVAKLFELSFDNISKTKTSQVRKSRPN